MLGGKDSGCPLAIDPRDPRYVYSIGVMYFGESTDGGRTWSRWDAEVGIAIRGTGVPGGALAVDNRDGECSLYAGVSGVMCRRRRVE